MIKIVITPTPESDHRDNFSEIQQTIDRTRWQGVGVTDRLPRDEREAKHKTCVEGPESFVPGSNE